MTSFSATPKSPTREQQMHPEFISRISIPASFRKPPSIPISPNSFSIRTTCSPARLSFNNFLINVVFPAPKNPEIMSIFVIIFLLFFFINRFTFGYYSTKRILRKVSKFQKHQKGRKYHRYSRPLIHNKFSYLINR